MSQFTDSAGSKSIDQREHNIDASAKRMILRAQDVDTGAWVNIGAVDNGDGTYSISVSPSKFTERYDYDSTTTIYTATAPVGTAEASTGWTINKYDLTDPDNSSGKIATDVSWTNRASGTYN